MKNKNDVEVLINGRKYTICGFESAEYLQKVATYINGKFAEFMEKPYYHNMDLDLRSILLAINIADDYFKIQKEAGMIQEDNECKDKMVLDMKHEILDLKSQMEGQSEENRKLHIQIDEANRKLLEWNIKKEEYESKIGEYESKIREYESKIGDHESKIASLGSMISSMEQDLQNTKKIEEFEKIEKESNELKVKLEAAERRISELESKGRRGKHK